MIPLIRRVLPGLFPLTFHAKTVKPTLYLTFDDGPTENTPNILAALKRYGAHATFFVLGRHIRRRENILEAIAADGHAIGNHSFNHFSAGCLSYSELMRDFDRCSERIRKVVPGWNPGLLRPPYGDLTLGLMRLARTRGLQIVMWNLDALDYLASSRDTVRARLETVCSGDIILFHDEFPVTCGALDELLPLWQSCGYTFEPLPTA
jgi:peptidoglycan-N-acetylglucosamine deacetylase